MQSLRPLNLSVKPARCSPVGWRRASCAQPRALHLLRAGQWAMDGLSGDHDNGGFLFDQQQMSVLSQRIALLRHSLAGVPSEAEVEAARATIPQLPQGGLFLEEMLEDHRLICDWHEQQWKRFGDVSANDHY